LKDFGLVLVVVVLILILIQVLCLKHCVLVETEASNWTAWVAVTSEDNTSGDGVSDEVPSRHAPWQNKTATLQLGTVRN